MPFAAGTFNRNYNFQNDQTGGIPAQAVRFDVEFNDVASALTFLWSHALTGTPANGAIPIGNTAGYTIATLTAGTNIAVTNAAGSITIASPNSLQTGGGTMTGGFVTVASAAGSSGLRLPHGAAPTSPINGDFWTTTLGAFAQINSVTRSVALFTAGTVPTLLDANSNDVSGYRGLPQNQQNTSYTLVLTDQDKMIYSANTGAQTITIPTNASVAFPVKTTIVLINDGTTAITISTTSITLKQAGTTNTGNRTLGTNGVATLIKVATDSWYISGAGIS